MEEARVLSVEEAQAFYEDGRAEAGAGGAYPCPDILWQGHFGHAANILGSRSWEVWLGVAIGLAARAQRNIWAKYYGNLYGMMYGLLVKPTGLGKKICTDVCEQLLPQWYTWRRGVQSGPGLATVLAKIARDKAGAPMTVEPRPACLIIPEWSTLAKMLKIQHATLAEDLNDIFDGPAQWNITRSDRPGSGGGDLVIKNPTLCICATTTESLFHQEVTASMIRSGFMNRYLILPGSLTRWKLYDEDGARIDASLLSQMQLGDAHTFGFGQSIWQCYEPQARALFLEWGTPLFEDELMNTEEGETEIFKRLHTYAHKISMLYAWSTHASAIAVPHVQAAIAVVTTSLSYLRSLLATSGVLEPPARVQYEISAKEKIFQKIQRESGRVDLQKLNQDLRKSIVAADIKRLTAELVSERRVQKRDKRWLTCP